MSQNSVNFSSYTKSVIYWPPQINTLILSKDYSNYINNNTPAVFSNHFWNININSKTYKYKHRKFINNKWIYYN